jgi:hypothetical protein
VVVAALPNSLSAINAMPGAEVAIVPAPAAVPPMPPRLAILLDTARWREPVSASIGPAFMADACRPSCWSTASDSIGTWTQALIDKTSRTVVSGFAGIFRSLHEFRGMVAALLLCVNHKNA